MMAPWRIWTRSFLLQSVWNFERLQNVGWAWAITPGLRTLIPDPVLRARVLRRHMDFFNTNPFLAPSIMGAVLRLEADATTTGNRDSSAALALKAGLMGPLAALGDSFFWSAWRPFCALLAITLLWTAPGRASEPLFYVLVFTLPGWWIRWQGLRQGWEQGPGVVAWVRGLRLPEWVEGLRPAALLLLGGLAAALGRLKHPVSGADMPFSDNFIFLGAGFGMVLLMRLRVHAWLVVGLTCGVTLLLGLLAHERGLQ